MCWSSRKTRASRSSPRPETRASRSSASCFRRPRDYARAGRIIERRPHGGRSGSAAGRRHRRSIPRAPVHDRRSSAERGATRRQQDHSQRSSCNAGHSHRALRRQWISRPARFDALAKLRLSRGAQGRRARGAAKASSSRRTARKPKQRFTRSGRRRRLVIEEFLQGEEVSFIVLSDGHRHPPARSHAGPQSGLRWRPGPTPAAWAHTATAAFLDEQADAHAIRSDTGHRPDACEANRFTGFLYAGLMMTADGPKVLEFNVRLGDPETQPLMHRLDSRLCRCSAAPPRPATCGDLEAATGSRSHRCAWCWRRPAIPGSPNRRGDHAASSTCGTRVVFQAGTRASRSHGLETAGGRVLGVTASGADLAAAIATPTQRLRRSTSTACTTAHDIGRKGLKRWATESAPATM